MLVLSRKKGESIVVNENITVTVLDVKGNTVRLGIEAPKDIAIHRQEVYVKIQETVPPPETAPKEVA
jgi:carbon storage regulator